MMNNRPNRIAELRRRRKISQEHLAEVLNVTQASISLYENKGNIPLDILKATAMYFGVTLEYLLCISETECRAVPVSDDEYNLLMRYKRLSLPEKRLMSDLLRTILKNEV